MPNPNDIMAIEQYLGSLDIPPEEKSKFRAALYEALVQAEAGDRDAQRRLGEIGITVKSGGAGKYLGPGPSDIPGSAYYESPTGQVILVGQVPSDVPDEGPQPKILATFASRQEAESTLEQRRKLIAETEAQYGPLSPEEKKNFLLYGQKLAAPTETDQAKRRKEIAAEEARTGQRIPEDVKTRYILTGQWPAEEEEPAPASAALKDLEYLRRTGQISDEDYASARDYYIAKSTGALPTAAMDPIQLAQLDLDKQQFEWQKKNQAFNAWLSYNQYADQSEVDRYRLGIEAQRAELERQQTIIQAAKTGQPLAYLSLLRGKGEPYQGGEIYQGLRRVVPPVEINFGAGAPGPPTTPTGMSFEEFTNRYYPTSPALQEKPPATVDQGAGAIPMPQQQRPPSSIPPVSETEKYGTPAPPLWRERVPIRETLGGVPPAYPAAPALEERVPFSAPGGRPPQTTQQNIQGGAQLSMIEQIGNLARQLGLGEEGARAVMAIALTEGGMTGAIGDVAGGGSYGPFQLYAQGQLPNYAASKGISVAEAIRLIQQNPLDSVRWALSGYLGNALKEGMAKGYKGPDLATYGQRYGQVSITPEKAGTNYQQLWGYTPWAGQRAGRLPGIPRGYSPGTYEAAPGLAERIPLGRTFATTPTGGTQSTFPSGGALSTYPTYPTSPGQGFTVPGFPGWEAPKMPPGMKAIQESRPLPPFGLIPGTMRPAGPQAQAHESPFEKAARYEAVQFQGIPIEDYAEYERRIREAVGPGLPMAGYAPPRTRYWS